MSNAGDKKARDISYGSAELTKEKERCSGQVPKVGEDNEWKDVQKKDTNNRPSETRNRRKTRKKIINKTSYFLSNSLNKSLNQKWKLKIRPTIIKIKIRKLFYEKWIPFQQ